MEQTPSGHYPECDADTERLMGMTVKRRVMDSTGTWHDLQQTRETFFHFDELVGFTCHPNGNIYPDLDRSSDIDLLIMDAALEQSKKTGLPLDLCFQTEVLKFADKAKWEKININMTKATKKS